VAAGFAGFRRPGKAVVVGLLIGLAEALIEGYISISNGDVILYGALFCVIIFRPSVLGLSALA
jgi:branched-subunit amino acid ABC-type transport system permease component